MVGLVQTQRKESARRRVLREVPITAHCDPYRYNLYLSAGDAKYGEAFWIAEALKVEKRKEYAARRPSSYEQALRWASEFWPEYEEINRLWLPEDPVYSIVNAGTILSTTADNLTFQAGSAGQHRVIEIIIGGEATASAVNRISVQRAGTSITANTAITPEKFNTRSGAASGTYGKAGTQALVGNPLLSIALNAFGGFVDWKAAPGEEAYEVNSEVLSMRSASGVSAITSTGIFEEL